MEIKVAGALLYHLNVTAHLCIMMSCVMKMLNLLLFILKDKVLCFIKLGKWLVFYLFQLNIYAYKIECNFIYSTFLGASITVVRNFMYKSDIQKSFEKYRVS